MTEYVQLISLESKLGHLLKKGCNSSTRSIEVLNMDLFGPISVMSLRRMNYTLVIVDDFTISQENHGIIHEFSVARTPQHYGAVERINKILKEDTRTMLVDFEISQRFLGEAVKIESYTQNRSMVNNKYVKHLMRSSMADEGIFLGYSLLSKVSRVFNKRNLNVEEFAHIIFDEIVSTDQTKLINRSEEINLENENEDEVYKRTPQIPEPELIDQSVEQNGNRWVYKNKLNEDETVVRNKESLVAQGFRLEEVIEYDETYVPIARLEVIRMLLAYASYKNFKAYQMEVKSEFLNEKLQKRAATPMSSSAKFDKDEGEISIELPSEGLTDFSLVPHQAVEEIKLKFSASGESIKTFDKKKETKLEYQLLADIVAKPILAKA
ncbi:uncharacterized protein LOC142519764 [Primulina tabacum]|uniref:uncharacterized protein LOC142519764 n=1 Tax=Primulina tabacum TaxID=48773 RepID=UPI003F5918F9